MSSTVVGVTPNDGWNGPLSAVGAVGCDVSLVVTVVPLGRWVGSRSAAVRLGPVRGFDSRPAAIPRVRVVARTGVSTSGPGIVDAVTRGEVVEADRSCDPDSERCVVDSVLFGLSVVVDARTADSGERFEVVVAGVHSADRCPFDFWVFAERLTDVSWAAVVSTVGDCDESVRGMRR
ncbi:hypothetical protein G3I44_18590 [Halogeometricum borinquense]|uniref:Uncharacterized protein n=1 Tax=Halogeometricum borinquense TaxID=60847 RepID=A0A6C0ULM1_9EURY|nr:hypothetical protein [Halogeometricum borinquense]QIB76100.1 hypothetical protein G3I44_18590 [Halogeometricum borinquense]